MINLLPPNDRKNIMYARRNSLLRRWIMALCLGVAGIGLVIGAGYVYMDQLSKNYDVQVAQAQADFSKQDPTGTQKQVQDITNSLKLVVQVLSREVLFSKLLSQIGVSLPKGSILLNLSINKVQGGIDLQFGAINYQVASQIQLNLQDPSNKIFDKADIVSIECNAPKSTYPCTASIRAQFAQNNPFLFINTSAASSTKK